MQRQTALSTWRLAGAAALLLWGASAASPALAAGSAYATHNLVSNGSVAADHTDSHLVNGWGLTFNPTGLVWLANNGTGTSTLYTATGVPVPPVVMIPPAPGSTALGTPTGIVFSGSTDFVVTKGKVSGPSRFIFCTQDGTISGWAAGVDSTHALIGATTPGASYTGLAIASKADGNFLYAADFPGGKIDVFNGNFAPVSVAGGFADPDMPVRYAPFNIQALDGKLYVAYAKRDKAGQDEQAGKGNGYVNVFDTEGNLLQRLVSNAGLNAPWGMAIAPATFGRHGGDLLVGNFGDGTISSYRLDTGRFRGPLRDANGAPLKIDGLWGMEFGNGFSGQDKNNLYFAAGPLGETGGVYGRVTLVAP